MKKIFLCLLALVTFAGVQAQQKGNYVKANTPGINFVGRTVVSTNGEVSFDWSGTYFILRFTGDYCAMKVSDTKKNYYNVFLDGKFDKVVTTFGKDSTVLLASGLKDGMHVLRVQKRTEAEQGRTTVHGFVLSQKGTIAATRELAIAKRHIEFIGNSLTCGYGTESPAKDDPFKPETENCDYAFGCIISRYFNADYTLIAHSGWGVVRNYGYKESVSPASMKDRMMNTYDEDQTIKWDFSKSPYKPSIVVINLGTNDFSTKPHPTETQFIGGYMQILSNIRNAYGDVPILCIAPRIGEPAYSYIKKIYDELGDKNIHFTAIMKGTFNGDSDLGASAHPNYIGQRKMAMTLVPHISTITGWEITDAPVK